VAFAVTGWTGYGIVAFGENETKEHDALKALLSMHLVSLRARGLRLEKRGSQAQVGAGATDPPKALAGLHWCYGRGALAIERLGNRVVLGSRWTCVLLCLLLYWFNNQLHC